MATSPCKLAATMFSLCVIASAAPSERYPVDWAQAAEEALRHYSALLRTDTSNPPGNETRAAKYLQSVLEREGVPVKLLALEPSRANLVARLSGNGSKKPILIMGHTDVVGVQRAKWSVDPFAAIHKNGFIYGRGAQDDKDNATAGLMLLLLLKRAGVKLDRDVIYLAEAGEEGTTQVGIDFLVREHWPEIAAEYALAEGGAAVAHEGRVRYVQVSTTEKVPRQVRLVAHGTAGHGSRPVPDNVVVHLSAAVAKFGGWQPTMRLNETTRPFFERLAAISPPEQPERFRDTLDPNQAPAIERYFFEHEPGYYTVLRTSVTPTMIHAGFRNNVIPSEGTAWLDVRALPDEDIDGLFSQVAASSTTPPCNWFRSTRPTGRPRPPRDWTRKCSAPSKPPSGAFFRRPSPCPQCLPGLPTWPGSGPKGCRPTASARWSTIAEPAALTPTTNAWPKARSRSSSSTCGTPSWKSPPAGNRTAPAAHFAVLALRRSRVQQSGWGILD